MDDVREIELTLNVVAAQLTNQLAQQFCRQGHDPGVDLTDRPLRIVSIALFDDCRHAAIDAAQNSTEATGIDHRCGDERSPVRSRGRKTR